MFYYFQRSTFCKYEDAIGILLFLINILDQDSIKVGLYIAFRVKGVVYYFFSGVENTIYTFDIYNSSYSRFISCKVDKGTLNVVEEWIAGMVSAARHNVAFGLGSYWIVLCLYSFAWDSRSLQGLPACVYGARSPFAVW